MERSDSAGRSKGMGRKSVSGAARPWTRYVYARSESTRGVDYRKGAYSGALQYHDDGLTPITTADMAFPLYLGWHDNTVEILAESGEHFSHGMLRRAMCEISRTVRINVADSLGHKSKGNRG